MSEHDRTYQPRADDERERSASAPSHVTQPAPPFSLQGAHGRNHSLSGTRIRQGVVNGLTVCQSGACGPLRGPGRLAKRCFDCSNRLLKRIAFRWWKRSLHPLTHCHRCCTEACCLRILPFCSESSSKAF